MAIDLDELEKLLDSGIEHIECEYSYQNDPDLPHAREAVPKLIELARAVQTAHVVGCEMSPPVVRALASLFTLLARPDPRDAIAAEAFAHSG